MSYLKNSLRLKITVFLLITALIFWLIPSNLIFGDEGSGDGGAVIEEPSGNEEGSEGEEPVSNPTISTDKSDYSPGQTVIVTGSGWQSGETVKLDFLESILQTIFTYYVDADGEGNISNNQYLIEERHIGDTINLTATGLVSGLTAQTVFTDGSGDFNNSISVHKFGDTIIDNDSQDPGEPNLSGVTFTLWVYYFGSWQTYPQTGLSDWVNKSTDGSGNLTWSGILGGYQYRFEETSTPSGYVPSLGIKWTSASSFSGNVTVNVPNTPLPPSTGTIIIHKDVQTSTGGAVSDPTPTFHYNIDGGTAQDIHDGDTITINDVTAGSHYVEETGTIPAGYSFYSISSNPSGTPSGQRVTFTVTSGGTTNVYITNRQCTGTVIVQKVIKNFSGEVVDDNTLFKVTVNGEEKPFSQNSPASFTVNPGHYSATEATPTNNYDIIGNTGTVSVGPGETKYITITNQQREGHITIIKHGLQNAGNAYNDYSMFRLYKGSEQIGATAELDNFTGGAGDPGRPDTFTWDGLDWGTYTIVEEYGASNYYTYTISYNPSDTVVIGAGNLNKTVNIYNNDPQIKTGEIIINKTVFGTANTGDFVFTVNDGVTPYTVNISGSGGASSPITIEAGKTYTITENGPGDCWDTTWSTTIPGATDVAGGITFFVDGDNIESIDGGTVSFENTRKSATITIHKDVIGPVISGDIFNFTTGGAVGFTLADDQSIDITIEAGLEYTVTETLPNLNWLSDIADDGNIEIVSETANSITFKGIQDAGGILQDSTINFTNTRKSSGAAFIKKIIDSSTGDVLAPTIGTFDCSWTGNDGSSGTFSLTSGNGYYYVLPVWVGIEYTVTEDSTDPELGIEVGSHTFIANEEGNPLFVFYNRTGSITVLKTDETSKEPLKGSTFRLLNDDGTPAIDAFGNPVGDKTSGADGKANFTKLAFGTYIIEEIAAPTGYSMADPVTATINGDAGRDITIEIENTRIPGRVTVIKTDPAGTPLDGVGFTIYYKGSGSPVMPERFTSSGLVTFDGLEWGPYVVVETTPPPGYDTSAPADVVIDATNAAAGVTVSRIDTLTAVTGGITVLGITAPGGGIEVLGISELPFTGLDPIIPISGISTIIAGGLMVVLSTIRKKFRKK